MKKIAVLLHNVRSAHNVGSIFRTADAAGVTEMLLTGYTPLPVDRFGRPQKDIAKTALGAERFIPWQSDKTPKRLLKQKRESGWHIVGVEQDVRATDYRAFAPKENTLYMFGNEVRGLSAQLRSECDEIIEIPMKGKKESLNVSVSAGIILFANR